jgi:hypothetical protein
MRVRVQRKSILLHIPSPDFLASTESLPLLNLKTKKLNSVDLVRKRTVVTE